jgi:D-3-phosphoglycerate dehydrogenase
MIIITAPVHPIFLETLDNKGLPFTYVSQCNYDELCYLIPAAEGLVVSTNIKIDKAIIELGKNLKWIARLGSGMEHIDVAYAHSKNINCVSSPEGNSNAVAEHAIGLLIGLMRNIPKSIEEVKEYKWLREENRGEEISGKTIGIIGYGNTGSRFARLLSSFDARVLVYDKYKSGFSNADVTETDLSSLCSEADIISFHVPLNGETIHMANMDFFGRLQRKPIIINTSRGAVLDTAALIKALQHKNISGAALDVLENEKLESFSANEQEHFKLLINQPNVILTPHIAGYTYQSAYLLSKILLEKLGI